MVISNMELADLVDEKVYSLIEREYLPGRKIFFAVWSDAKFEDICREVESLRPANAEDLAISQKEVDAIVFEGAQYFLFRLKAMMAAGDI